MHADWGVRSKEALRAFRAEAWAHSKGCSGEQSHRLHPGLHPTISSASSCGSSHAQLMFSRGSERLLSSWAAFRVIAFSP